MNPLLIVIAILILSDNASSPAGKLKRSFANSTRSLSFPPYFDTFKMELFLDKLSTLIYSLDKINNVNQMSKEETKKLPSVDRIHESLEAVKDLIADQKAGKQISTLSNTLSGIKQMGGIDNIIATMAPMMSILSNQDEK